MLAVPFASPENLVLDTGGFVKFLQNKFYNIPKATCATDVSCFAQIRRDALISVDEMVVFTKNEVLGKKPTTTTQNTIIRYCYHLRAAIPRLQSFEDDMELSFKWKTAFSSDTTMSSNKLIYDLACCIWNLGAAESLMGATIDRSTEEGIKAANKHFQSAAGYFDSLLKEDIESDGLLGPQSLPCLHKDSLNMTKHLMLAQAQLCFYEKAVKDRKTGKMKATIIAKIAIQTSKFYQQASTCCALPGMVTILDLSWYAMTDFQSKVFTGAAEYWQSIASKEWAIEQATGFSEEVIRLRRAQHHVAKALDLTTRYAIAPSLLGGAEGLLQKIQAEEKRAVSELETVYMEALVADSSLIDISPIAMVKPTAVPEYLTANNEPRFFQGVVPKETQEANQKLMKDIQKIYQDAMEDAERFTYSARTILRSLNLPGSFESYLLETQLPEGVWLRVEKVQTIGGLDRLKTHMHDIQNAATRAQLSMDGIEESLKKEEKKDEDFRAKYTINELNHMRQAAGFIADLRLNTQNMRNAYNDVAQKNDVALFGELGSDTTLEGFESVLYKSKAELAAMLPSKPVNLLDFEDTDSLADEQKAPSSPRSKRLKTLGPHAIQLNDRLHELEALLENREKDMEALRQVADKDHTLAAVDAAPLDTQHEVRDMYMNKMKEGKKSVSDSVEEQEELMQVIKHLNQVFLDSIRDDPTAIERAKVLQSIQHQTDKFFSLQQRSLEAVTFYAELQTKLNSLQQSSDDHGYTQEMQRHEFEHNRDAAIQKNSQDTMDRSIALKLSQEINNASPVVGSVVGSSPRSVYAVPAPRSYGAVPAPGSYGAVPVPAPTSYGAVPAPSNYAAVPAPSPSSTYTVPVPGKSSMYSSYSSYPAGAVVGQAVGPPRVPLTLHYPSATNYAAASATNYTPSPLPTTTALHATYGGSTSHPTQTGVQTGVHPTKWGPPSPSRISAVAGPPSVVPAIPAVQAAPASGVNPNYISPVTSPDIESIKNLMDMGFERDKATAALSAHNGNQEAAVNMLLNATATAPPGTVPPVPHQYSPSQPAGQSQQYGVAQQAPQHYGVPAPYGAAPQPYSPSQPAGQSQQYGVAQPYGAQAPQPYGAQAPQQYGVPQPYGAQAPQQYGVPASQPYGAQTPQLYGAQQASQPYGAPPPSQQYGNAPFYGAPAPQPQPQQATQYYGAPAPAPAAAPAPQQYGAPVSANLQPSYMQKKPAKKGFWG